VEQVFQTIYERNDWGLGSGPGSLPSGLEAYYRFLEHVLRTCRPSRVVDFGCGYFAPYANIDWGDCAYIGIDVVEKCAWQNLRYVTPKRAFLHCDWCDMAELPEADLALCKDVLQHWSHQDVCRGLARLSKYPFVLITNSIVCGGGVANSEIGTGGFRPLNVALPPYSLPAKESQTYRVGTNSEMDEKLILLWEARKHPFHNPTLDTMSSL
jgi:SAM-dependent methyltransferase